MKNLVRSFFLIPVLVLIGLALQPQAVGPIFINLVPITGLSSAASVTDSNLFYVNTASAPTGYKRATAAVLKLYMGNTSFTVVDTVSGLSAVVLDTLLCSTANTIVNCKMKGATGTSNATSHALVPIAFPAAWKPTTAQLVTLTQITDNGTVAYSVKATVATTGGVTLTNNGSTFTASGTFALAAGLAFSYNLQ